MALEALVLAAGASSRMGRPKAGVRIPGTERTFLSRLITTLLDAGLPGVTVVTGAAPEATREAWTGHDPRVRFAHNEDWAEGQLRSLQCGLAAVDRPDLEAVLVALVDIPLVDVQTVRDLVAAWRRTRAPIVRPARGDEHGHPVIFGREVFAALTSADPAEGAKPVVRAYADRILNVAVADAGAFRDFDTPEDLRASAVEGVQDKGPASA